MNGANLVIYPSFILLFHIIDPFPLFHSRFGLISPENDRLQMYRKLRISSFSGAERFVLFSEAKITGSIHFGCLHFNIRMDSSIHFRSLQLRTDTCFTSADFSTEFHTIVVMNSSTSCENSETKDNC